MRTPDDRQLAFEFDRLPVPDGPVQPGRPRILSWTLPADGARIPPPRRPDLSDPCPLAMIFDPDGPEHPCSLASKAAWRARIEEENRRRDAAY
jgi:hypothetical protein